MKRCGGGQYNNAALAAIGDADVVNVDVEHDRDEVDGVMDVDTQLDVDAGLDTHLAFFPWHAHAHLIDDGVCRRYWHSLVTLWKAHFDTPPYLRTSILP